MTISQAAALLGRAGGRVRSPRKAAAARTNGKRGGRPKLTNRQIDEFADKVITNWREISK